MPKNEILTFADADDANVIEQIDYADLAAQQTGFPKGLLPSAQINKVLRQSAFIASAIGQLVASTLNEDVLDDGDRDALVTKLVATVAALASVDAPVQSVAGRTGAVVLLAADISDSGAAGRQVVQAATAAAIKSIIAIAAADITDSGAAGRAVLQGATAAAIRTTLGLGSAALAATTAFDAAGAATAAQAAAIAAMRSLPVSDGNANRDLTSADCWVRWIRMTNAGANTVTLSLANLATMADGDEISGIQAGTGQSTLTFTGGITVVATPGLKTRAQGSPWTIKRADATHVDVIGDLAA